MNLNIIRDKEQIYQIIKACDTAFEEPVIGSCSFDLLFSKICNYAIFIEACANDSPLGYAAMYANDIESRVAYLTLIAVRPDYQNMGIGSALIEKCVCCAKDYNMKIVYFFPQLATHAGTERILIDKMNYLADHYGCEVYALTYEQGNFPLAYPLSEKVIHVDLCVPLWRAFKYNYVKRKLIHRGLKIKLFDRFNTFISDVRPDILVATPYHEEILEMALNSPLSMIRVVESHLNIEYMHGLKSNV